MFRPLAVLTMVMAIEPLIAPTAGAECVKVTPKTWIDMPSSELVFSGTVVDVTRTADLGYRATFEVARVWKGSVRGRIDLYV